MSYSAFVQKETAKTSLPFISRRSTVYGTRGMVSCSQPLAAEAGLRVLRQGGNAADAAVAVAAALQVTEPCSTGLGGDAFALFYSAQERRVRALAGNGRSPAALTLEAVRAAGVSGTELPPFSALTVPVPGAAALWEDAVGKWGRLSLGEVLQPAIELAEGGFPVAPITAFFWRKGVDQLRRHGGGGIAALLTPEGAGPRDGQRMRNADVAAVMRRLAELGAKKGFYSGPVAEALVAAVQSRGGLLALEDLAAHDTEEVEAISTRFRGLDVWELPPPNQGITTLMALNLLEADLALKDKPRDSALWLHSAVESLRLAFADALAQVGDAGSMQTSVEQLLSKSRAQQRRGSMVSDKACVANPDAELAPPHATRAGDTVYFCTVDAEGNGCSFINSNYMGFGTGIVPEGCGFSLQNRLHNFTLQPGHPNCLGPSKKPYHTIAPALVTDADGDLRMVFGSQGGFQQPQSQLQILVNLLDHGMDPQEAIDYPRFSIDRLDSSSGAASAANSYLLLEDGVGEEAARQLAGMGHHVTWPVSGEARQIFGRGALILRDKASGVLAGAADPRADGCVLAY